VYSPVSYQFPRHTHQLQTGKMKPKLLYKAMRQTSPRKIYGNKLLPTNRYRVLPRDHSPADSVRSSISNRSVPVKRKAMSDGNPFLEQVSYAEATASSVIINEPGPDNNKVMMEEIVKVKSITEKVSSELTRILK
jgi:hypothetical protein